MAVYKDRMKLVEKENKSYYCKRCWPIAFDVYQTLDLLGSGGFGEVYRCYNLETNKIVALKRMFLTNNHDESTREEFFRHMKREAEIQMALNHENIAKF